MTAVDDIRSATGDTLQSAAGSAPRRGLTRAEAVAAAATQWRDELAAVGGRDPLLHYRDLKTGTLDLAAAEPEARKAVLEGEAAFVSKLFPHEPLRSSALRSAKAIRDASRELWQERGIAITMLAVGVATWSNPYAAHRPAAPVLLRRATVTARDPAETDFVIEVVAQPFVNPMLLKSLDSQLGLRFSSEDLADSTGELRYTTVVERLREFAPAHVVDGFSIAHRAVIATFATEPLELAGDIDALGSDLETHDVVAALSGDDAARAAIASKPVAADLKFDVFDLDASQQAAVEAVVNARCLYVDAPPGSGRTQTIAAAVTELIGRGSSILVVGPKRVALDDLIRRLDSVGVSDAVVDVAAQIPSDLVTGITATTRMLAEPHAESRSAESAVPARLAARLDAYRDALHQVRLPWGTTAYDAMAAVAAAQDEARSNVRVRAEQLATSTSSLEAIRDDVLEYAELGGLMMTAEGSPWHGARITSEADATQLLGTVTHLHKKASPALRDAAVRSAVEVGLAGPTTLAECTETVELLTGIAATLDEFGDDIWAEPLDDLIYATGNGAYRARNRQANIGYLARRRLRRRAAELTGAMGRAGRLRTHQRLLAARDQLSMWKRRSRGAKRPRTGPHLPQAVDVAAVVKARFDELTVIHDATKDIPELPFAAAGRRLAALLADAPRLRALPRLRRLEVSIAAAGFTSLVEELRAADPAPSAELIEARVSYVWHVSLLDHWRSEDAVFGDFDPAAHEASIDDFCAADEAALRAGWDQVLAGWRAAYSAVAERHEGQAAVVAELGPRQGPQSPRGLLDIAPELTLAASPCWVMSPYAVAALPPKRLYDVVIIDGAGRLPIAHAIPAIARARQVILVGDDDVTLPTFAVASEPAVESDDDAPWNDAPEYSLLDALGDALPRVVLSGQHRSRDDRAVRFTAAMSYAGRTTVVPSAWGADRLVLETVDVPPGDDGQVDSSSAEVARVVELILEHLRVRGHESLGVVTLGARHARNLDGALRRALVRAPDVAKLLDETRAEPFFVKEVGQVSGDVRDAVIVSLGYGRSVDGRILYRFGALGRPGGERQLATMVTRARERMTVVSTFGPDDLSPRRLATPGAQALGEFLTFAASGDLPYPRGGLSDPLASAIAARLRSKGVDVDVGCGGPGGVSVAARHPNRKDRLVLAVETDGPAYADRGRARVRHRQRRAQLGRLGWTIHTVWSVAWARDPDAEIRRLLAAYEQAVADADAYDWAVAAAEADVVAGMPDDEELSSSAADDQETAETTPRKSGRIGSRPVVNQHRSAIEYSARERAAMARWVESDGVSRNENRAICALAAEFGADVAGPEQLDPRTRDALRHAVRVARAGAPSRL